MKRFIISFICSASVSVALLFGVVSYAKEDGVSRTLLEKSTEKTYTNTKKCYPYDKYYLLKKWLPLYIVVLAILFIYVSETKDRKRKKQLADLSQKIEDLQDELGDKARDIETRAKLGQEYEKYIGRYYRRQGYNINYNGIKKGFDDEGIDIICTKKEEILVIQCKNWAKDKILHENYIFQFYGAWKFFEKTEQKKAIACLYCSCKVTNQARIIARILGIKIFEEFKMLRS